MNRAFPLEGRIIAGETNWVEDDGHCIVRSDLYDRENSILVYGVSLNVKNCLEQNAPFYMYVRPNSGRSRLEYDKRKVDSYMASFLALSPMREFDFAAKDVVLYSPFNLRQDSDVKNVTFNLPAKSEVRDSFNLRFSRLLSLSQSENNGGFVGIEVLVPPNDNYLEANSYISSKNVHDIIWSFFETYSSKKRSELILFSSEVDRADIIGAIRCTGRQPIEIMRICQSPPNEGLVIPSKL